MGYMRTKAVLIGIQYSGSQWDELDGPHHDVKRMRDFLKSSPWQYAQYRILLDKPGYARPDREGIISALNWLVEGATEDHRLFLHYSGHGDQSPTSSASEPDGFDETIIPVDCPPPETEDGFRGAIRDNLLRELLVDALPAGCHLTAIFDCCHSGSILDLRYCYPRYLSIPWAWRMSGPACDSPRLNRTITERQRTLTLPISFANVIPPDLDELRQPIIDSSYLKTPTPHDLWELEETPRPSFLMSLTESRSVSQRGSRSSSVGSWARPQLGLQLQLTDIPDIAHLTLAPSIDAIDSWRSSISYSGEEEVCESPVTASPTSTIAASSRRPSLLLPASSTVLHRLINLNGKAGVHQACYVDREEETLVPFRGIQYDRPVRSRGTFAGFHQPAHPQGPAPLVCSFSACYDHQVTFEIGNGDGLLTSAFIECMNAADHEITYGQLLVQMKKYFIRKNEERSSDKLGDPPFPMLSSLSVEPVSPRRSIESIESSQAPAVSSTSHDPQFRLCLLYNYPYGLYVSSQCIGNTGFPTSWPTS